MKRTNRDSAPGSLFGEKLCTCYRCKNVFKESELTKFNNNQTDPSFGYIYLCEKCK